MSKQIKITIILDQPLNEYAESIGRELLGSQHCFGVYSSFSQERVTYEEIDSTPKLVERKCNWEFDTEVLGKKIKFNSIEDDPLVFIATFENLSYRDDEMIEYTIFRQINCDCDMESIRLIYPDHSINNRVRKDFKTDITIYSGKEITDDDFLQKLLEHTLYEYIS